MLISFEGLDGCGKTTIVNKLINYSKNKKIYLSCESDNEFGKLAKFGNNKISNLDTVYLWWLARRLEQNNKDYKNADIILKDRYYDSTYVYQELKYNKCLLKHNYDERYFNKPNLTFIIDISVETSIKRKQNRLNDNDLHNSNNLNLLNERRYDFLNLPNFNDRNIHIINGEDNIDNIFSSILKIMGVRQK